MPAYKSAFLKQVMDSIVTQTYKEWELIVVDDASPEDLKSIVDQYDDSRISYYRNAENIGGRSLVVRLQRFSLLRQRCQGLRPVARDGPLGRFNLNPAAQCHNGGSIYCNVRKIPEHAIK